MITVMFYSYSVFKDQVAVLCRSSPVICLCDFAAVIRGGGVTHIFIL